MQATSVSASANPSASTALARAAGAAQRARSMAQLRIRFIARDDATAPLPPLARMLRGGQGGQVRLKLFLSYLWMQTNGQAGVSLAYPAQVWAELLGLKQPATAGARRINEAQAWLERNRFVTVEANPGRANRVTILNETGTGDPYQPPGFAANRLKGTPAAAEHFYLQIPATFWTNGYMAELTGAGLAFYLILLDQYGPGKHEPPLQPVWFSPSVLRSRYGLSDDTRAKGMHDLNNLGLITISRRPVTPDAFDLERLRNTYTLIPETLDQRAQRH